MTAAAEQLVLAENSAPGANLRHVVAAQRAETATNRVARLELELEQLVSASAPTPGPCLTPPPSRPTARIRPTPPLRSSPSMARAPVCQRRRTLTLRLLKVLVCWREYKGYAPLG